MMRKYINREVNNHNMRKIFIMFFLFLILLSILVLADADINNDGVIDILDLIFVAQNFGKTYGFTDSEVDTDNNGIIDIYDVVYVASRIGTTTSIEIAYWSLNGNAIDSWGNNDCTLYGSPTYDTGTKNQGLKLDGTNDYANCGNDASLEMGTNDWTITAWIKLQTTQPTWVGIIEKGAAYTTTEGYWFNYYLTTGDLKLYISNGATREVLDSSDNLNLNDGTWHHVAVSFDRSDKANFYVDGTNVGTDTITISTNDITNPSNSLKIGYSEYLNGVVDEIKIYRKALSQQEIINDMGGTPPTPPTQTCYDGTQYNQCSNTKPMYCQNGTLIQKCTTCGCPTGQTCRADNTCITTTCTGACKANACTTYYSCSSISGTCESGYCCSGTCTTPTCTGSCKINPCNTYTSCSSIAGTCASNYYCCTGSCTSSSGGNEVYAQSLSVTDIRAAISSASSGDTVVLPAGTNNAFSSAISVPNGISLRGQGKDKTILKSTSSSLTMFSWTGDGTSSYPVEISGFKLSGTGGGNGNSGAGIKVSKMKNVKVHDIEVSDFAGVGVYFVQCTGVIYNSYLHDIYPADLGQSGYCVAVAGDDVFDAVKPPLGTGEMLFIEDSNFSNCKHGVASNSDSKHVVRHNEFRNPHSNRDMIDEHGKQPQHNAGSNIWEVYENKVYGNPSVDYDGGMNARGGTGVIWNNKFYDLESTGTPAHKAINMYLDEYGAYPDDYPNKYQIMDTYVWGNTLNDNPLNTVRVSSAAIDWIKKDRDYFMYAKPGYTPYPYPHPLRTS